MSVCKDSSHLLCVYSSLLYAFVDDPRAVCVIAYAGFQRERFLTECKSGREA